MALLVRGRDQRRRVRLRLGTLGCRHAGHAEQARRAHPLSVAVGVGVGTAVGVGFSVGVAVCVAGAVADGVVADGVVAGAAYGITGDESFMSGAMAMVDFARRHSAQKFFDQFTTDLTSWAPTGSTSLDECFASGPFPSAYRWYDCAIRIASGGASTNLGRRAASTLTSTWKVTAPLLSPRPLHRLKSRPPGCSRGRADRRTWRVPCGVAPRPVRRSS